MPTAKIKIEDAADALLSGNVQKNAQDLFAFMRTNKMNPMQTSTSGWKVSSKGCVVCYIWVNADSLVINPFIGEYKRTAVSDKIREIALAKKSPGTSCPICHVIVGDEYPCSYKIKAIFGKELIDACARSILFKNPSHNEIECVKELLLLRKDTIKNGILLPNSPKNYTHGDTII